MNAIFKSVGKNGINWESDVMVVQGLLNENIGSLTPLRLVSANGRCGKDTIDAIKLFQERVVKMSKPDGKLDPAGQSIKLLVGTRKLKSYTLRTGVALGPNVITVVEICATQFFATRNKRIHITSGTRSAQEQAQAMFTKIKSSKSGYTLQSEYKDKKAAKEIQDAYDANKTKSEKEAVAAIEGAINDQIRRNVYISKHLRAGAFDVQSISMDKLDIAAFKKIAEKASKWWVLENNPPHFHLQAI